MTKYIIYNIINLICFTILTILFHKWWIILFALLFVLIPTNHVNRRFRVCDCCGRHSESGYTDEEALKNAARSGWLHIAEGNKDFCPDCLKQIKEIQNSMGT